MTGAEVVLYVAVAVGTPPEVLTRISHQYILEGDFRIFRPEKRRSGTGWGWGGAERRLACVF